MKKLKRISLVLFCIYIAAVVLLCVIRTDGMPELPKFLLGIPLDKIMHFLMFLPFPVLGYLAFHDTEKGSWRGLVVLGLMLLLGMGFAFSTERLQSMTDYRSFETADMIADCVGMVTGAIIVIIHIIRTRR